LRSFASSSPVPIAPGTRRSVSAIVVNYEGGELLLACLSALEHERGLLEMIIVDNGSADGSTAAAVAAFPNVKVVAPTHNRGFAGGANAGAEAAGGELLLFLNPDVRVGPGAAAALAAAFGDPLVGVAGPVIAVAASDALEYGSTLDVIGSPVPVKPGACPLYVPGCALMTRASLFRELGGFDERFFMFVEDVDYCWRALLRGFDVRVVDSARVDHAGGAVTPGGYLTEAGVRSTRLRVVLRERNTLAMLLKCYGNVAACAVVPVYIAQSLATAGALFGAGRRRTARGIVAGLGWNARELPRTFALRREAQSSRRTSDLAIIRRMYRGIWKLTLLFRFGIPPVSETDRAPVEAGL
jgi:GT2 family glycosyltransferase